ncbi:sodium:solute symporter family protein [Brevibacillus sp. NRS-1366]|uniref:sodium:solute symporter family protein n=1 Tax=Brevibacillus sp. NRS-1366 TaxID=3233899 RepID=UPI003D1931AF
MAILSIILFFAVILFINRKNFGVKNFDDYATSGGSFGMISIALAVFSTWYVGASFTAWAGFSVGYGFIGVYVIAYGAMTLFIMYLVSEKTYLWGKKYKINTQAELMDLRYRSKALRLIVGFSGVIFTFPWLLMEWITQGYVFSYATGGKLSPFWGMLIGVVVVLLYVATGGMRSVITANLFQGAFMFIVGTGLMFWLIYHFFGSFRGGMDLLNQNYPEVLTYPGPGWNPPTPYWTSIIVASGLGGFMWPWVYNKLFAAESLRAVKKSTLLAPILGIIFWASFTFLGQVMHSMEYPRTHPEEAYMWIANEAGPLPLALMSVLIMAASVSTVSGIIQAMSTSISSDLAKVINRKISDQKALQIARISVVILGLLALAMATVDNGKLIFIALLSYQGIIMLFPVVLLGLYWKRANKEGAIAAILIGTTMSMYLSVANPAFIGEYGWSSGIYGTIIAFLVMFVAGYLKPVEAHVEDLWKDIEVAREKSKRKVEEGNFKLESDVV